MYKIHQQEYHKYTQAFFSYHIFFFHLWLLRPQSYSRYIYAGRNIEIKYTQCHRMIHEIKTSRSSIAQHIIKNL